MAACGDESRVQSALLPLFDYVRAQRRAGSPLHLVGLDVQARDLDELVRRPAFLRAIVAPLDSGGARELFTVDSTVIASALAASSARTGQQAGRNRLGCSSAQRRRRESPPRSTRRQWPTTWTLYSTRCFRASGSSSGSPMSTRATPTRAALRRRQHSTAWVPTCESADRRRHIVSRCSRRAAFRR